MFITFEIKCENQYVSTSPTYMNADEIVTPYVFHKNNDSCDVF